MLDALKRLIKAWEEDGNGVHVDACERNLLRALSGDVPRGPALPARTVIAAMEFAQATKTMRSIAGGRVGKAPEAEYQKMLTERTAITYAAFEGYLAAVEAEDGK